MREKIQSLFKQLNKNLVQRDEAIKLTLLAVLAGEHIVLVGPPGTGKSLIARKVSRAINFKESFSGETDYFEYLLTKFSTPEEIFGPLSIKALKEDRFERNVKGYLPAANVAFLDEIFKASSSILNSLLTIINERIYHNGCEMKKVPLQSLVAASNELPAGDEGLAALYDRFLFRCYVDYLDEEGLAALLDLQEEEEGMSSINFSEVQKLREDARLVDVPAGMQKTILSIWKDHKEEFKEDSSEEISDRRMKKVLYILKFSAITNNRKVVDFSDILLLKDCIWNNPKNREKVQQIVVENIKENNLKG